VTGFWPNWWALPAGSPHPKEGFQFIEFFSTKGWETWYQYIMDTPVWKDFPDDVLTKKLVDQVGEERAKEVHQFFTGYLENAVEMWTSPIEDFAKATLASAVDQVLHKTKSPAEALGEAQEIVKAKLQETVGG
jgi:ABC-type glycerol-3-phosphate transport system substrate-binding protein